MIKSYLLVIMALVVGLVAILGAQAYAYGTWTYYDPNHRWSIEFPDPEWEYHHTDTTENYTLVTFVNEFAGINCYVADFEPLGPISGSLEEYTKAYRDDYLDEDIIVVSDVEEITTNEGNTGYEFTIRNTAQSPTMDVRFALFRNDKNELFVVYFYYETDNPYTGSNTEIIKSLDLTPPYFSDVTDPNYWAFGYIQKLWESGITTGYPDGTYRPENNVTRAEMAAFLIRAKIGDDFIYEEMPHFPDVSSDHWAFKYIQKLWESGITTGYPDGTYRPENNVTRAEMAAFLGRAFLGLE